jgi:dihydrofolate synthase/folylpolyglutamate synthase
VTSSISSFQTYADLAGHLDGLGMFRMRLGLDRIEAVLAAMDLVRPPFGVVHVVGTNGKGGTAAFVEALGREHGLSVGLYTSPHFLDFRERAVVDGRILPEAEWLVAAERVMAAGGGELTYFEFMTAASVVLFESAGVDLAVMEAGLGGTYDATRALAADLVLVTRIGLEHTAVLGATLSEIAADKAGALRPGVPAVSGRQAPEAEAELLSAAGVEDDLLSFADAADLPLDVEPGLRGPHQRENAALALAGWRKLSGERGFVFDSEAAIRAVRDAWMPGRFQIVPGSPELILDCGHNPQALMAFANALETENVRPKVAVFTCLRDKDLAAMAGVVREIGAERVMVPNLPGIERARPAAEVAASLGGSAVPSADLETALADLPRNGTSIICGSLFLLAEFFRLRPDCLRRQD